jgi:hypothetical protein
MTAWTTYLKPCKEEYFKTVAVIILHELHFRREACLGGKGRNDRCCGSAGVPLLVPAQVSTVTQCSGGEHWTAPQDVHICVCA